MHVSAIDDVVDQQLREELAARVWAVHALVPTAATDLSDPDVAASITVVAGRWAAALVDPCIERRAQAVSELRRILWPAFGAPGDEWWATPLGEAIRATSRAPSRPSPITLRRPA